MQIYLDPHKDFAVYAPAKVGSSTIRGFLWEILHGTPIKGHTDVLSPHKKDSVWGVFEGTGLHTDEKNIPPDAVRVALHRSPEDRLLSWYRGHVAPRGVGLDTFLSRLYSNLLGNHRKADRFRVHVLPQVSYLGTDLSKYDIILPLPRIGDLPDVLGKKLGRDFPVVPHLNISNAECPPISDFARGFIDSFTAADRFVGWNGATTKL